MIHIYFSGVGSEISLEGATAQDSLLHHIQQMHSFVAQMLCVHPEVLGSYIIEETNSGAAEETTSRPIYDEMVHIGIKIFVDLNYDNIFIWLKQCLISYIFLLQSIGDGSVSLVGPLDVSKLASEVLGKIAYLIKETEEGETDNIEEV